MRGYFRLDAENWDQSHLSYAKSQHVGSTESLKANIAPRMSALPPKAGINHTGLNVRFVPIGDIGRFPNTAMRHIAMPVEELSTASKSDILTS